MEDGPTLTHGEMKYRRRHRGRRRSTAPPSWSTPGPTPWAAITATFQKYPGIGTLLPAMGYGDQQVKDLEATIAKVPCDVVVIGTPIDINRVVKIHQPTVRVTYQLQEIGKPDLEDVIGAFVKEHVQR